VSSRKKEEQQSLLPGKNTPDFAGRFVTASTSPRGSLANRGKSRTAAGPFITALAAARKNALPRVRPGRSQPNAARFRRAASSDRFPRAACRFPIGIGKSASSASVSPTRGAPFSARSLAAQRPHPSGLHACIQSICCAAGKAAQQMPPQSGVWM